MKRIILLLLLLLVVFGAVSCTEDEPVEKTPSKGLEYVYDESGENCIVWSIGTCQDADLVIPSEFNKKPVIAIADEAFRDCETIKSVTIPDSVKTIGLAAFYNCKNLSDISLGKGVESIGEYAFLQTALYNEEANWKDGVLYVGKYLLQAKDVTECTVKKGTVLIADAAFRAVKSLTSVRIPKSVIFAGTSLFYDCQALTTIACEAKSQPDTWHADWNKKCSATVQWGK